MKQAHRKHPDELMVMGAAAVVLVLLVVAAGLGLGTVLWIGMKS